ncbi:MAG: hypothetical protein IPL58_01225 [Betaproteobacteria bacterium]|uniref:Uncharacterized protein n=1 Tax=Candidatus Proximibacter danicus TaxID=2954365 RepID=A0A9D7JZT0_9PROT|nr:hypothetical protein [Candidatus Proximibacter danicus]
MTRRTANFLVSAWLMLGLLANPVLAQTGEGELPALPLPTEAQLQRGRELLDKIIYVIDNVPLTDAAAVLKVFGFTEPITREQATYTYVQPRAGNGRQMLPADLVGTGWASIQADPVRSPSQYSSVIASFEGDFAMEEACAHIDEVRQRFAPRALETLSRRMTYIHPNPRPPRQHDTGHLVIRLRENPLAERTRITFTFEYQLCAKSFSFSYARPEGAK